MARKTVMYTVDETGGRDRGKTFLLTEMPAAKAEDWAMKVLLAMLNANVDVPDNVMELGMAGLAEVGLKKLGALPFAVAKPLLDELMECVQVVPNPQKPQVIRPLLAAEDIEEVATRLKLKWEVLSLHVDFSPAGDLSKLAGRAAAKVTKRGLNTKTFQS
jgi:hypothetical protein